MLDLFLSEWRRSYRFILLAAFCYAMWLLWGHFNNFHVFELNNDGQYIFAGMYIVQAVIFALFQLRGHHPQQRWQWLLHRPMPRPAIFGALALAAAAQIVIVVGLPLMLTLLGTDLLTYRTVDLRHYLSVVTLVECCMIAWLVVATAIFSTRWTSIVVAILPCLLLVHRTTALVGMLLAGFVMLLYALIAYSNFKPDRKAPPEGLGANLIVAAPLLIGNFIVVMVIWVTVYNIHFKMTLRNSASSKVTTDRVETVGGMESARRMKYVVAKSDDPRRQDWLRELDTAPVYPALTTIGGFAKRQQQSNLYSPRPYQAPNRVLWSFDHDQMLFTGIDADSGEFREQRGLYGKGDKTPFPAVPLALLYYLVTPHTVHAFDAHAMTYPVRILLRAPERVESEPKRIGKLLYMRSNQRLIAYHADRLSPDGLLVELFSIPLPSQAVQKVWIDVAPLQGSTLIMFDGNGERSQDNPVSVSLLYAVDRYGQVALVKEYREAIPPEQPTSLRNTGKMFSPALYATMDIITPIASGQSPRQIWERATRGMTGPVAWIALALAILGSMSAWLWLRRGKPRAALAWAAACLLLGLPVLLTLVLLHPRQRWVATA